MGLFLGNRCGVGPVGVVGLVYVKDGEVEGGPEGEGKSQHEHLIPPAGLEQLAE